MTQVKAKGLPRYAKAAYQKNVDYDTARQAGKTKYMKKEEVELDDQKDLGDSK